MSRGEPREWTQRDGGLQAWPLRLLNRVGRLRNRTIGRPAPFESGALEMEATRIAGFSDFGGDSFREPLAVYCEALEREANLSAFGRIAVRKMIVGTLATRLSLWQWTKTHPRATEERIEKPWIVLGMPRTGTSLLSQLLSLDPLARAPLQWETRAPVPPASLAEAGSDPRIAECEKALDGLKRMNPALAAMHPFGAMLAEECVPFLMLDFRTLGLETQALVPSYGRWLEGCDMTPAYRQHQMALQALQSGQPTERWVLKTPNHLWAIETLLEFYPEARLVWTHRDPGPVVTSVASLNTTMHRGFSETVDPAAVGREWKDKLEFAVGRGMAYDDGAKPGWCAHLAYGELMRDPLEAIRRLYAQFDEELHPLHERRITAWLADRHQTVHGKHVYDPADYGWSWDGLAEEFRAYRERFDIERERRD